MWSVWKKRICFSGSRPQLTREAKTILTVTCFFLRNLPDIAHWFLTWIQIAGIHNVDCLWKKIKNSIFQMYLFAWKLSGIDTHPREIILSLWCFLKIHTTYIKRKNLSFWRQYSVRNCRSQFGNWLASQLGQTLSCC